MSKRRVFRRNILCYADGLPMEGSARRIQSGSSIHKYFQEWAEAGFFERLWAKGLEQYDELEGIGWEWQSMDGSMVKAPLARESVERNPTEQGKNRDKTQRADR